MGKHYGVTLDYKTEFNDQDYYVYHNGFELRFTKLYFEKGYWWTDDSTHYKATSVPMLTFKEFQERYFVRMTYFYGKKKVYTVAEGEMFHGLHGSKHCTSYDLRTFVGIHWRYQSPRGNLNYIWNDMKNLQFIAKKGQGKTTV